MNLETGAPMSLRRQRLHPILRNALDTAHWNVDQLICPIFVGEDLNRPQDLKGLVGHQVHTFDSASRFAERLLEKKVRQVILFGVPAKKHPHAAQTLGDDSVVARTCQTLKTRFAGALFQWVDVCLCSYTDTGQCGFMHDAGFVDNRSTVEHLAQTAAAYAAAGADGIAPSDMMDGRIGAIRHALNAASQDHVPIMSYASKFASAFYGPFREAAQSAPKTDDPSPRANYQISPRNRLDAIRSARRDVEEGADVVMVKPGLPYLDIIRDIANERIAPLAVYQVSGEFASLMTLAHNGYGHAPTLFSETMTSFVRAGAQLVITYAAEMLSEVAHG